MTLPQYIRVSWNGRDLSNKCLGLGQKKKKKPARAEEEAWAKRKIIITSYTHWIPLCLSSFADAELW